MAEAILLIRRIYAVRVECIVTDAPVSLGNNNISTRRSVAVTPKSKGERRRCGVCSPWIMARVTLASLTFVSLKLRSDALRYRQEVRGKDASLLAEALLHHRRAAAMADDKRATCPHRVREREVNLPRIQWRSLDKRLFFSPLFIFINVQMKFLSHEGTYEL